MSIQGPAVEEGRIKRTFRRVKRVLTPSARSVAIGTTAGAMATALQVASSAHPPTFAALLFAQMINTTTWGSMSAAIAKALPFLPALFRRSHHEENPVGREPDVELGEGPVHTAIEIDANLVVTPEQSDDVTQREVIRETLEQVKTLVEDLEEKLKGVAALNQPQAESVADAELNRAPSIIASSEAKKASTGNSKKRPHGEVVKKEKEESEVKTLPNSQSIKEENNESDSEEDFSPEEKRLRHTSNS